MPIAPALCCKSCISDKVVPADSCFDLNFCSGHGVCNLGVCECQEGFGGADCKYRVSFQILSAARHAANLHRSQSRSQMLQEKLPVISKLKEEA